MKILYDVTILYTKSGNTEELKNIKSLRFLFNTLNINNVDYLIINIRTNIINEYSLN